MQPIINIKHGNERLFSQNGLLPVGVLLEFMQLSKSPAAIPGVHCVDPDISHGDILSSMVGLICMGQPDFSAIEIFRGDQWFFTQALRISNCPFQSTLRQRIDLIGAAADTILKDASAVMVRVKAPMVSAIRTGAGNFVPLDIDVSPFDNSKTRKEKVSGTYKGFDGYAPILAYPGNEGYLINVELQEDRQHCQKNTPEFIRETLKYARRITQKPLFVRLDSGSDSQDSFIMDKGFQNIHFSVKRNLRKESLEKWLQLVQHTEKAECTHSRRKTVWTGQTMTDINENPLPRPIIFKVTERYEKKGEMLLFPEIEAETYWCTLPRLSPHEVNSLYHDHGTSEQFHSEIKSDLGVERFPSSRFAGSSLILHLTLLACNILRIIGQTGIEEQNEEPLPANRCKKVSRRGLRTVMQGLIYMAGRLIYSGRQRFISFGSINPFAGLADRILLRLRNCSGLGSLNLKFQRA